MFDVEIKYPWLGLLGKPRYFLVYRNVSGYSIISEYTTYDDAENAANNYNDLTELG